MKILETRVVALLGPACEATLGGGSIVPIDGFGVPTFKNHFGLMVRRGLSDGSFPRKTMVRWWILQIGASFNHKEVNWVLIQKVLGKIWATKMDDRIRTGDRRMWRRGSIFWCGCC